MTTKINYKYNYQTDESRNVVWGDFNKESSALQVERLLGRAEKEYSENDIDSTDRLLDLVTEEFIRNYPLEQKIRNAIIATLASFEDTEYFNESHSWFVNGEIDGDKIVEGMVEVLHELYFDIKEHMSDLLD